MQPTQVRWKELPTFQNFQRFRMPKPAMLWGLKQSIASWAKDLGLQRSKACLMGGAETVPAEAQKFHEIMTSWKCSNISDVIEKYLAQTIHEENYLKSLRVFVWLNLAVWCEFRAGIRDSQAMEAIQPATRWQTWLSWAKSKLLWDSINWNLQLQVRWWDGEMVRWWWRWRWCQMNEMNMR